MKTQVNARLSEAAISKLEWLTERYGTQTSALEVAISSLYDKENGMSQKVYTTPRAALAAAQKKIGGRITTIDGALVLTITEKGLSGQVLDNHLTPRGAAERAGIIYRPPRP